METRKIDSCYICTTPYQIWGALALHLNREETADLYIVNQFIESRNVANRIIECNFFDNVKWVDESKYKSKSKNKVVRWASIVNSYINVNSIFEDICINGTEYLKLYISSKAYVGRVFDLYYLKNNFSIKRFYFEDGIGSYCNPNLFIPRMSDRIIRFFLYGFKSICKSYELIVFCPELFNRLNKNTKLSCSTETIDKSVFKNRIEEINYIFQIQKDVVIEEDFIVLDNLNESLFDDMNREKLYSIYHTIEKHVDTNDLIYKPHPRDKSIKSTGRKYYKYQSLPLESIALNTDFNNKVLLGVTSTAIVSPKMLFEDEPYIVLLYKLVKTTYSDMELIESVFQAIREVYKSKSKFFIPESEDELIKIIDELTTGRYQEGEKKRE